MSSSVLRYANIYLDSPKNLVYTNNLKLQNLHTNYKSFLNPMLGRLIALPAFQNILRQKGIQQADNLDYKIPYSGEINLKDAASNTWHTVLDREITKPELRNQIEAIKNLTYEHYLLTLKYEENDSSAPSLASKNVSDLSNPSSLSPNLVQSQNINDLKNELLEHLKIIKEHDQALRKLENLYGDTKYRLQQTESAKQNLQLQLNEAQNKLNHSQENLENLDSDYQDLLRAYNELKQQYQILCQEHNLLKQTADKQYQHIQFLQSENNQCKTQILHLQTQINLLVHSNRNLCKKNEALLNRLSLLNQQINKLQNENHDLKEQQKTLINEIKSNQLTINNQNKQIKDLKLKNNELIQYLQQARNDANKYSKLYNDEKTRRVKLKEKYEALSSKQQQTHQKLTQANSEVSALKNQLKNLEEATQDYDQVKQALQKRQNQAIELEKELNASKEQSKRYLIELKNLRLQINELKDKVAQETNAKDQKQKKQFKLKIKNLTDKFKAAKLQFAEDVKKANKLAEQSKSKLDVKSEEFQKQVLEFDQQKTSASIKINRLEEELDKYQLQTKTHNIELTAAKQLADEHQIKANKATETIHQLTTEFKAAKSKLLDQAKQATENAKAIKIQSNQTINLLKQKFANQTNLLSQARENAQKATNQVYALQIQLQTETDLHQKQAEQDQEKLRLLQLTIDDLESQLAEFTEDMDHMYLEDIDEFGDGTENIFHQDEDLFGGSLSPPLPTKRLTSHDEWNDNEQSLDDINSDHSDGLVVNENDLSQMCQLLQTKDQEIEKLMNQIKDFKSSLQDQSDDDNATLKSPSSANASNNNEPLLTNDDNQLQLIQLQEKLNRLNNDKTRMADQYKLLEQQHHNLENEHVNLVSQHAQHALPDDHEPNSFEDETNPTYTCNINDKSSSFQPESLKMQPTALPPFSSNESTNTAPITPQKSSSSLIEELRLENEQLTEELNSIYNKAKKDLILENERLIEKLNSVYNEALQQNDLTTNQLEILRQEKDEFKDQNKELTEKLINLSDSIAGNYIEKNLFNRTVKEKHDKFKNQITDLQTKLENFHSLYDYQCDQITELQHQLNTKDLKAEQHHEELFLRDNVIQELDNVIRERDNVIRERDNVIQELDNMVVNVNNQLHQMRGNYDYLQEEHDSNYIHKDNLFDYLKSDLESYINNLNPTNGNSNNLNILNQSQAEQLHQMMLHEDYLNKLEKVKKTMLQRNKQQQLSSSVSGDMLSDEDDMLTPSPSPSPTKRLTSYSHDKKNDKVTDVAYKTNYTFSRLQPTKDDASSLSRPRTDDDIGFNITGRPDLQTPNRRKYAHTDDYLVFDSKNDYYQPLRGTAHGKPRGNGGNASWKYLIQCQ